MCARRQRDPMECNTEAMRRGLLIAGCTALLGALALLGAPVAVASCGGSAGNQQYVDPLGSSCGNTTTSSPSSSSPSSTSHTSTPVSSSSASGSPASNGSSSSTGSGTSGSSTSGTSTTSTTPTATTSSGKDPSTLPYTGFNAWLGTLVGIMLAGLGVALRRFVGGAHRAQ